MSNAKMGEQLVGAFHKLINECEVVSYNQFSERVALLKSYWFDTFPVETAVR